MANSARLLANEKLNEELTALKTQVKNSDAPKRYSFCKTPVINCFKPACFKLHPELKKHKANNSFAYLPSHTTNIVNTVDEWLIDSGCNRLIKHDDNSIFDFVKASKRANIQLGDDIRLKLSIWGKPDRFRCNTDRSSRPFKCSNFRQKFTLIRSQPK
jgi:hypothetical protein